MEQSARNDITDIKQKKTSYSYKRKHEDSFKDNTNVSSKHIKSDAHAFHKYYQISLVLFGLSNKIYGIFSGSLYSTTIELLKIILTT